MNHISRTKFGATKTNVPFKAGRGWNSDKSYLSILSALESYRDCYKKCDTVPPRTWTSCQMYRSLEWMFWVISLYISGYKRLDSLALHWCWNSKSLIQVWPKMVSALETCGLLYLLVYVEVSTAQQFTRPCVFNRSATSLFDESCKSFARFQNIEIVVSEKRNIDTMTANIQISSLKSTRFFTFFLFNCVIQAFFSLLFSPIYMFNANHRKIFISWKFQAVAILKYASRALRFNIAWFVRFRANTYYVWRFERIIIWMN